MHRFVTLPFAPLSLGLRWDRISRMTVLLAFFRDLAITSPPGSNAGRSPSRNGRPRQMWHGIVLLSHGSLPCPIARLNALPSPGGGELAGGSQAMHSPVWIEAWTIRLPDDTTPVELNAHPMFCTIQRTKRVRLTFPVTLYDDEGEDCTCCGSSDIYFADGK